MILIIKSKVKSKINIINELKRIFKIKELNIYIDEKYFR